MSSSREQTQHARGIGVVVGFLQQMLIDDHDGVGAQHRALWMSSEHRARLVAGQPLRIVHGLLVGGGLLGDVGWINRERDGSVAQ